MDASTYDDVIVKIEYAIYSRGAWKTWFRDFLSGRVGMDLSAISQTDACKLGNWLENEARRMLSPEDHAEACRLHAAPMFLWGEIPRGRGQFNAHRLIHMGGRHDSVVASLRKRVRPEQQGRTEAQRETAIKTAGGKVFALDHGRLMGDPFDFRFNK